MSEQTSELPRSVQIMGRYKTLIGFLAVLGLLGGTLWAVLNPPRTETSAFVVFAAPSCPAGAICGGPAFSPGTSEAPVIKAFPTGVQIKSVTGNVLSISAIGGTAAQAQAIANRASRLYIAFVDSLNYMGQQPSAAIIQPATTATETTPPRQLFNDALLGAVVGALVGIIAALAASQAIIDTPTVAQGLSAGEAYGKAARAAGYQSTPVSLEEMARDSVQARDVSDGQLGTWQAYPP
jgi:hypothetical protein